MAINLLKELADAELLSTMSEILVGRPSSKRKTR
jgi:hypothetical protein